MGPDSVKEVKGAVNNIEQQSDAPIRSESHPVEAIIGSIAEVSKYDCLNNFCFPSGPNIMPSADELISVHNISGTVRIVVNSPRVGDQGAKGEPAYLDVFAQKLGALKADSDVVIDLGRVKYLASPIVGALSSLRDRLQQNGCRLILQGDAPDVATMLEVTGFLKPPQTPKLGSTAEASDSSSTKVQLPKHSAPVGRIRSKKVA